MLILLVEDDPDKVLPEELTYEMREIQKPDGSICLEKHSVEPLYCNIWAESEKESMRLLKNEFLRIAAPLLGCGYDDLFQRYLKRRMRRRVTGMAVCMAVISIIGVLSYAAWVSRRAQALVYEYTAKDCVENGEWSQALMYYGKALELDPAQKSSQMGAMILLQQHIWPYLEAEEECMGICGNRIYTIFYQGEDRESCEHSCVSVTPSGNYMLWGNIRGDYIVTNGEGEPLYTLDGKGSAGNDGTASGWVFYNPGDKVFTFHWPERQQEYELHWPKECSSLLEHPSACILAGMQAVVNDNQNLYVYELDVHTNQEIMRISLDSIFGKRPAVSGEEEWEETDRQEMWSSADGRILAVSEVVVRGGNRNMTVCSKTALFDTEEMELLAVIANDQYALEKVVFSEDGEYFSLLYNNNISNFVAPGGLACVYTRDGKEAMRTDTGYSFIPRDAVFSGNSFLVWDYTTIHFWDIASGQEYAVPITTPEAIQGVLKLEDGRYAVEWLLDVHYYNLASFGEEKLTVPSYDEVAAQADMPLDEPCLVTDSLYVYLQDDGSVALSDEEGNLYDVFSFKDEYMQEIISVFYIPSVETLFFVDAKDSLYGIPVLTDKKQFMDVEETCIASFVGSVCGAKDGVLVWCYLTNSVRYYTRDIFDRFPQYLVWEAMQENTGVFLGMCDNDKYAVFVVQNEKNEKFIAEIRDMKTGKYINEFTLDDEFGIDAMLFDEDGNLSYLYGEKWSSLKIDAPLPDRRTVRQVISLSGHTLDENQVVISNDAIVKLDGFGNWSNVFK
ncbi:MAG: hypothetical protein K2G19_02080 [Lachnospiraceae bacterium]|nr:hypothetical protein [Lachnospiraceae bacterium]